MLIPGLRDRGCCCSLGRDDISGMFLRVRVVLPLSSCTALPFTTSQAIPPYSQTLHHSQTARDPPFSGSSTLSPALQMPVWLHPWACCCLSDMQRGSITSPA